MDYKNFKFRAYFECSIPMSEDDVKKQKQKDISFRIYNICLYDNGECGIYLDDLVYQLANLKFNEFQIKKIIETVPFTDRENDWIYFNPNDIEQFTGIKDAKGRDLYEGDIIKNFSNEESSYCNIYYNNGYFGLDSANGFIPLVEGINMGNDNKLRSGIIC